MIYFDNASTSWPKPKEVLDEVTSYFYHVGVNPSRGAYQQALHAEQIVSETREGLAEMFNVQDPDHLCFTLNATQSLNIVLKGLLKPGDHVLISNFEHNSIIRPLERILQTKGISYTVYESDKDGFFNVEQIENLITDKTRLITCNHGSNVIGVINPLATMSKLAQKHNLLFLVDCAQTAGHTEIDVEKYKIDFLAGTAHKSLLGPSGVGFLYIKNPDLVDTFSEGGSGHNSSSKKHPKTMPLKFEAGTPNYLGIAGFNASLRYLKDKNYIKIHNYEMELLNTLISKLKEIDEIVIYGTQELSFKIPLLSFNVRGLFATECSYTLDKEYNICTRGGLQCAPLIHRTLNTFPHGTVRVSLGYNNSLQEVDTLIDALKKICSDMRPSYSTGEVSCKK